jgi:hypothetical protein
MKLLLFIAFVVGLIALFYFLARLIVNHVPRKFHWMISLLLLLISVYLGYKIYDSIIGDIKFNNEKVARYQKVIDRLKIIRDAEVAHRTAKGDYTNDYNKLISFIENDSMPLTRSREMRKTVIERGVPREIEYKVTDTVGWRKVFEDFKDKDYKNMMNVPASSSKIELKTGYVEKGVNKYKAPVFEAKVSKNTILEGLPKDKIKNEVNIVGVAEINGEYITVGTLEDVKETGNWPPSYDKRTDSDQE